MPPSIAPRWERIQHLFHEAAALPVAARLAWLEDECEDDSSLVADVIALLEEDASGGSLLDRGIAEAATRVLATGLPEALRASFGAYTITELLGEGGMGVVYLARRNDLGTLAAIKILRDAWLSPSRRERFASEQRTLAQLNHPSIARLYDAEVSPTARRGSSWSTCAACHSPRTPIRTRPPSTSGFDCSATCARRCCTRTSTRSSIATSSRRTSWSPTRARVKLLDFGIAKQLESLDGPGDHTRTGMRLMTPAYAAPEQLRGGRLGIHTDVYSLGVILYELLTGRLAGRSGRSDARRDRAADRAAGAGEAVHRALANRQGVSRGGSRARLAESQARGPISMSSVSPRCTRTRRAAT